MACKLLSLALYTTLSPSPPLFKPKLNQFLFMEGHILFTSHFLFKSHYQLCSNPKPTQFLFAGESYSVSIPAFHLNLMTSMDEQ